MDATQTSTGLRLEPDCLLRRRAAACHGPQRPDSALAARGGAPPLRFDTGGERVGRALPSPDGRTVAAQLSDGTLQLWRSSDGAPLGSIPQEGASLLAFSADSTLLAAAGYELPARVWRIADWELLQTVPHQPAAVFLGFAPDNTLVVHTAWPSPDARGDRIFAPDGRLVAQADWDGSIRLEERACGEVLRTLRGHAGSIWAMAFSPDGSLLASAGLTDNMLRVWRVADGRQVAVYKTDSGGSYLAFAPDNRTLAASEYRRISFWSVPEQP